MSKLYVPLRAEAFDRLRELARAERRRPQDQAAIFIERALLKEGARKKEPTQDSPEALPA